MDLLLKALDGVVDEESFVRFLKALSNDRVDEVEKEKRNPSSGYASGPNGWEHSSIEDYLEAAAAWAEDTQDGTPRVGEFARYSKPENVWKRCADIIYAGKIYE